MTRLIFITALSAVASASIIQLPLLSPINSHISLDRVTVESKPLVTTEAIQADIKSKNLLKRAEKLFEIAQLGVKEYNHPTRVIGSDGMPRSYPTFYLDCRLTVVVQATWERSNTFTQLLRSTTITIPSRTRPSTLLSAMSSNTVSFSETRSRTPRLRCP